MSSSSPAPGEALAGIAGIVAAGLCHRCGACAGVCGPGVIAPGADHYPEFAARAATCTQCGLCLRVCPGAEFSFPEHYARRFGAPAALEKDHGHFLKAFLGYATDPELRRVAASGGLGTRLPQHLLERGAIRGAFSVRADPRRPWASQAMLARSAAELRQGTVSKYTACSLNHLYRDLRGDRGPYLFTGLPCHVHGLLKMAAVNPAIERKTSLIVGLLCHSCLDPLGMQEMLAHYGIDEREMESLVYRHGKLPGYWRARMRDGRELLLPYPRVGPRGYRPTSKECLTFLFKLYSPARCRMCIDGFAEFADISIGDPYLEGWQGMPRLKLGYNLVFARTPRGLAALEAAQAAGVIALEPLSEREALASEVPMIRAKRSRAFYTIRGRARRGLPVPRYGLERSFPPAEARRAARHVATYYAADRPRLRRPLNRLLLSPPGRWLVGAFFFRRRVLEALWARVTARHQRGKVRG